ncbi:hypothetical protein B5P19_15395 [Clavibacter sepedonicus]|uniref:Secreted protein n=1 Tax=Clavibacter sepedonicus TaxID=31964 RepID=B0RJB1_CLASE|nr:hypothetical protein B5P19_15395 [Clavibacter sepedonicus]OQJ50884.1 hypothetical protein B5P20_15730 [Clavibacter sepedonicus]CAQ03301.1 putative secreted protein [Clavibacter sepedonicus]
MNLLPLTQGTALVPGDVLIPGAVLILGVVVVAIAYDLMTEHARWSPFNGRDDYFGVDLTDVDAASHRADSVVRKAFERLPGPSFLVAVSHDENQVLAVTVRFRGPVPQMWSGFWRKATEIRVQKLLAAQTLHGGEWTTHWGTDKDEVQFTRVQTAVHLEPVAPVADDTGTVSSRAAVDLEQMHADAARARWARVACAPTSDERRQANEACAHHLDTLLALEDQRATADTGSPAHRTVLASEPFTVTLCEQNLHAQTLPIAHEVGDRREPVGS